MMGKETVFQMLCLKRLNTMEKTDKNNYVFYNKQLSEASCVRNRCFFLIRSW